MHIKGKTFGLWLATAILSASFLLPIPALAQKEVGDLSLTLIPFGYYVEAKAGQDNLFYLEVRNTGNMTLTNIKLSTESQPEGWTINFAPDQIASLTPGKFQTVDVTLRLPNTTTKGVQETVYLVATSTEIAKKVQSITVSVKGASFWLWVGIGLTVVVVAVFVIIFLRMNRQK